MMKLRFGSEKAREKMRWLRRWLDSRCPLAAWFGLASASRLFAQAPASASKEAWVVPYFLVILLVGLGLFVICRPSHREKKVKKD
jgi:hypothetical protein